MTDISLQSSASTNDFVIVKSGNITLTATSAVEGVPIISRIAHSLNYLPIPVGYINSSGTYVQLPTFQTLSDAGTAIGIAAWVWLTIDSTYINLNFFPAVTANYGTINCKYQLFKDRANQ